MTTDTPDDYLLVSVLEFSDGGPIAAQPLHRGTKASCERVAELISALSYSGDRTVKESYVSVIPWREWETKLEESRATT